MGIERERTKGQGAEKRPAGVRTFALVGLLGGLCALFDDSVVLGVGAGFVGLAAIAGYLRSTRQDPGLTTEIALLVAFLLGALAHDDAALAAGLGVVVTILLASRTRLHAFADNMLSERELHDGLIFAAAALVVLPLVPNRTVGPYSVLNPFTVWRLVSSSWRSARLARRRANRFGSDGHMCQSPPMNRAKSLMRLEILFGSVAPNQLGLRQTWSQDWRGRTPASQGR